MTAHSRKRRRRETISFTAECLGALSGVLTVATLFFAMLGFTKVSAGLWFLLGALVASFVSRAFDDERNTSENGDGSAASTN